MASAAQIILDAFEMIGVAEDSQALSAYDAQMGLRRLNDILDTWATQSLYSLTSEFVFTLTGKATYSFSTDFHVPVPAMIPSGFVRFGTIDYPFELVSYEEFASIGNKTISGSWPIVAYFDSVDTITFYPIPAGGELHLGLPKNTASFADLNTIYPLQAGVKKALAYSLAEDLAIVYKAQMPPSFYQKAQSARRVLKRLNLTVPILDVPFTYGGAGGLFNKPDPDGYQGGNAGDMLNQ